MSNSEHVRKPVFGSPVQPRQIVRVVAAVDTEIHDASGHLGRLGLVEHLDYSSGVGQRYPNDPMICVRFSNGQREVFWAEELLAVS